MNRLRLQKIRIHHPLSLLAFRMMAKQYSPHEYTSLTSFRGIMYADCESNDIYMCIKGEG